MSPLSIMVVQALTQGTGHASSATPAAESAARKKPRAPWMTQSRHGKKAKKGKSGRKLQPKHGGQQGQEAPAAPAQPRLPLPPWPHQPGVAPLRPFLPSAARELMHRRPDLVVRGGRCRGVCSDMVQQLRRLQCPLLWPAAAGRAPSKAELYKRLDSTPHRPTLWHVAVEYIDIACQFARLRILWKSRELLEEVYAILMGDEAGDPKVDVNANTVDPGAADHEESLLRRYRAGLKHVVDASWLMVREDQAMRRGLALPDGTPLTHVLLYDELDNRQRASVWAMRSLMGRGDAEAARKALELEPDEGQWLYVQGLSMRSARARKRALDLDDLEPAYTPNELSVFLKAYGQRPNPQTILRLARCFVDGKEQDRKRCDELLREALERFPRSAYVQLQSGHLFESLGRGARDDRRAKICFQQALHLGQHPQWLRACLEYGLFCLRRGDVREGRAYYNMAVKFFPEAGILPIFL